MKKVKKLSIPLPPEAKYFGDIYKEIRQTIVYEDKDVDLTIKQLVDKFYGIMEKYNIRKYTKSDHGSWTGNSAPWCICEKIFHDCMNERTMWYLMLDKNMNASDEHAYDN